MHYGQSTCCERFKGCVVVSNSGPERQNFRCIIKDFRADACSSEGPCLREAATLDSTSSMADGVHKAMSTTDLAFHVFTGGQIQWLSPEFSGVMPLPRCLVRHIHRHYSTVGSITPSPADVTRPLEVRMSYRGADD